MLRPPSWANSANSPASLHASLEGRPPPLRSKTNRVRAAASGAATGAGWSGGGTGADRAGGGAGVSTTAGGAGAAGAGAAGGAGRGVGAGRGAGGGTGARAGSAAATTSTSARLTNPLTPTALLVTEVRTLTEYQSPARSTTSSSAPFSRLRSWNESVEPRL